MKRVIKSLVLIIGLIIFLGITGFSQFERLTGKTLSLETKQTVYVFGAIFLIAILILAYIKILRTFKKKTAKINNPTPKRQLLEFEL